MIVEFLNGFRLIERDVLALIYAFASNRVQLGKLQQLSSISRSYSYRAAILPMDDQQPRFTPSRPRNPQFEKPRNLAQSHNVKYCDE